MTRLQRLVLDAVERLEGERGDGQLTIMRDILPYVQARRSLAFYAGIYVALLNLESVGLVASAWPERTDSRHPRRLWRRGVVS